MLFNGLKISITPHKLNILSNKRNGRFIMHDNICLYSGSNTLPKRKVSEESGVDAVKGRSLPGEKLPRPGSWNSHIRNAKPVLPNKYSATPPAERSKYVKPLEYHTNK